MTIFSLSLAVAIAALTSSQNPTQILPKVTESGAQTLPDGNVVDAAPSLRTIAELVAKTKKNLVTFDAGTFEMGDWGPEVNEGGLPFDGPDSKPLHKVRLNHYSITKFPVTYAEFDVFTAALRIPRINQSDFMRVRRKSENPAGVSWQGAYDYCEWLGKVSGLSFELPTEAQWEYAARSAGRRARYPTDNGELEEGRNLPNFEQREAAGGFVPVDSFPPNAAGIYYMGAGVLEWTNDWYNKDYYDKSPAENPKGPGEGATRVVRGHAGSAGSAMTFKRWQKLPKEQIGTWTMYPMEANKVTREVPYTRYSNNGDPVFRCVLN
jgi:formylglycine-generating enzyme required for sulfatase activity